MNSKKIKGIVRFSIKQNIQNKWFVIFNVLLLILVLIMTNASNIAKFLEDNNIKLFDNEITIEYIDKDNVLGDSIENTFEEYEKVTVKKVEENNYTKDNIEDKVIVVEVFKDDAEIIKAKITSKEGIDETVYDEIMKILQETRVVEFSNLNNISKDKLELLNSEVTVERVMLGVDAENSDTKQAILFMSTIIVYMISIFIFSKIANEIANEKVSKSIEYVLTSVTAKEYLLAKIISITSIVLIQAIFVLVYYMIGNLTNSLIMITSGINFEGNAETAMILLDKDIIAYICIIFIYSILTLILLAIIQAALSSKTTSMSEAGNSMTFLMVITISVYMLTFALITPYTNMTTVIYILSCIPLISNYFIPAILIIGQAKTWQIIISLILLVLSIPIAFNICSKIFKNGVLDYSTKKTRKSKVRKELTLKEEQNLKLEKSKFRMLALTISLSAILYFVAQVVMQLIFNTVGASLLDGILLDSQKELVLMALTSILSLIIPYGFLCLYLRKEKHEVKIKYTSKAFLIAVFFTVLLQIALIIAQIVFGLENTAVETILEIDGLDNIFTQILFVLTIAVIPGIFEELFFRKGLIDLTRKFGDKFAILISSIVFGICHLNLTQGIFAFFMGLILGTLYVKTGKMRYNITLHALNNSFSAIGTILMFLELDTVYFIIVVAILAIALYGGVIAIVELVNKLKRKEKIFDIEGKFLPENVKYMFTDFTFILGSVLMILAFIVTEEMLKFL